MHKNSSHTALLLMLLLLVLGMAVSSVSADCANGTCGLPSGGGGGDTTFGGGSTGGCANGQCGLGGGGTTGGGSTGSGGSGQNGSGNSSITSGFGGVIAFPPFYLNCASDKFGPGIWFRVSPPKGGEFIWFVRASRTYLYGPPPLPGVNTVGLAGIRVACVDRNGNTHFGKAVLKIGTSKGLASGGASGAVPTSPANPTTPATPGGIPPVVPPITPPSGGGDTGTPPTTPPAGGDGTYQIGTVDKNDKAGTAEVSSAIKSIYNSNGALHNEVFQGVSTMGLAFKSQSAIDQLYSNINNVLSTPSGVQQMKNFLGDAKFNSLVNHHLIVPR